ncbi:(2E,6E)-farnesyl diphosphate synthase [Marinobacteraceae bacterium S3BR75-40.1]
MTTHDLLARLRSQTNGALERLFERLPVADERLHEAMRYSVLGGGKRLRAALVLATAEAFGADDGQAEAPASAVELIHAYSLIHDDLPAMDDDDLRRGQPTCHIAFGEAPAILAGDALQALAFELLTEAPGVAAPQRLAMVRELSRASGADGMVGGQMLDLAAAGQAFTREHLERIHRKKTGALIEASLILGALSAPVSQETDLTALRRFGRLIGLAFQVQDDILDVEASTEVLGKQQGADAERGKATYPALMGLEAARDYLGTLFDEACQALDALSVPDQHLQELAQFIIGRDY